MIIFSRSTLREALNGLRVLKLSKNVMPIYSHVLVFGYETIVEFDATDLDQYLRYTGEGVSTTATRLLVPIDVLQTAGKMSDATTEIRITGGQEPSISYMVGGVLLVVPFNTLPVSDFPDKPAAQGDAIAFPAGVVGAMNEALSCASTDESRYILNSVYLDAHAVVATDGRQLYRRNSLELAVPQGSVFPSSQVPSILPNEAGHLWLWHHDNRAFAQIAVARWHWITKLIDGNFPNYHQVIPNLETYGGLVRISEADAARLLSVLPKLPGFKEKDSKIVLSVTTEKGAFLRTAAGLPKVHLALDRSEIVRPVATEVAFNARYFISALQHGLRELHARDDVSALAMSDSNRIQLWMPLRDVTTTPAPAPEPVPESAGEAEAVAATTAPADVAPEATSIPSDPSSESPAQVVSAEPAPQVPVVSENQPIVSVTTINPPTTMVAPATNPTASQTREDTAKPGVVASPRASVVSQDTAAANVSDALQTKFAKVRDLLRDLGNELGGIQVLLKESGRQFKALERDHETLKKNIRALREVNV